MKVYFAADHAGFALKNELRSFVQELGHEVVDCGAVEFDATDDYPVYVEKAAQAVSEDPANVRAIILGGSGQGEAMCANRFPHVRAAVFYGGPIDIINLSRAHNDANVLSLGARFIAEDAAKAAVKQWLLLPFSEEERHARRIAMLN